ncbi:MAG: helix-turn-helix transcriptional regulator, partial [Gemmatimonadetes bacterium]|nr:helix-turn-helix transcriptional regulator [Gemmatimonadota bacterium]
MTQPDAFSIQRSFNDFDEFAEAVHDWKLDFVQLERGPFEANFEQAAGAHFQLGHVRLGRRLHQQGETPSGLRTFVVPGDAAFHILWRGKEITGRDIGVFPEGGVLDSVSLPGFDVFVPSLPEQLLDERARRLGLPPVERIVGGSEVMRCDPDAVDRLRSWLRSVMTELVEQPNLLEDPQTSEAIAWAIAGNLLTTLATGGDTPVELSLSPRLRVSESSLDYIACHPGRVLRVREVADAVGVSERTLRRAFQERF